MKYSRQSHKTIYLYSCHVYKIRPKLCWLDASVIRLFWDRSKEVTEHLYSWTKYAFVCIKHSLNHKNWSEQHALQNPGMLGKWAFATVITRKHQLSISCEVYTTQSHTRPNTLSISSPLIILCFWAQGILLSLPAVAAPVLRHMSLLWGGLKPAPHGTAGSHSATDFSG